jgi:hypothetical protein
VLQEIEESNNKQVENPETNLNKVRKKRILPVTVLDYFEFMQRYVAAALLYHHTTA